MLFIEIGLIMQETAGMEIIINQNEILNEELNRKIKVIKYFIDYDIPDELNNLFKEIGWENNAQKIFATIFLGAVYLISKNKNNIEDKNSLIYMFISKKDLKLIYSNLDKFDLIYKNR